MTPSTNTPVAVTATGAGYVIHPEGSPPSPVTSGVIEQLPAEPGSVSLLVTPDLSILSDPVIAAIEQLLSRKHRFGSRKRHWDSLRLVVPRTGAPRSAGRPPVGAALASRLGCTVVAPTGSLWIVPDHSLLVHRGDGLGAWRQFTPDQPPRIHGCRFPSPPWQPELLITIRELVPAGSPVPGLALSLGRVVMQEIPAGLWLRVFGSAPVDAANAAFAAEARPDQCVILVGEPGAADAVSPRAVSKLLRRMSAELRRVAVLVDHHQPHGGADRDPKPLGAAVAAVLGEPVLASPGLPLRGASDTVAVTMPLENGLGWRPFPTLVEFRPKLDHPVVVAATPPLPGWPEAGAVARASAGAGARARAGNGRSVWPLLRGWEVEIVQAGLWIRPAAASAYPYLGADDPRLLPVDPTTPVLVVTAPGETSPGAGTPGLPAAAIDQFVARLPVDIRQQLRRVDRPAPTER